MLAPLLGLGVGALVEVAVMRRFADAPRLVLTVATIGLAQVLGGIELLIPQKLFGADGLVLGAFETPLSSLSFEVGPALITGNHLLAVAVVPVVVGALAWFLRRSLAGTAIRAAAENTDRARLLGVPVRNLTTIVWALAGGLAALTFVLKAPFLGASPSAAAGPAVLLPALAAAIVARMESLPVAFVAAVGLGVMEELVRWNSDVPALVDVVLLVVILVALLTGEGRRSRAHDADGGWRNADLVRGLVPAVAGLPLVRWARRAGLALLVAAAVVVPLALGPSDAFSVSVMCIWAIVAVSLVVLTGWAGQISLGQFAIVGAGAIVAGNLVARWNVDLFITLAVATATGAVVAVLLGIPALRIKGPFLAVVTLAFAVVLDGYVLNPNVFPELIPQSVVRPLLWGRLDLEDERTMLWFCLATLALCVALARGVRRSRSGRLMIASRDNRKAAEAASVPSRWSTLSAFVFSGALAGLAGGLHVLLLHGARAGSYQVVQSVEVFSGATIGGLGSLGGAAAGAAGLRGAQDLDATIRLVGAGVGVLVVLWVVPAGLAGVAARLRDLLARPVAARAGMDLEGQPLRAGDDTAPAVTAAPAVPAGPPPFVGTVDGADVAAARAGAAGHRRGRQLRPAAGPVRGGPRGAGGRDGRAARHQRRRQVDHPAGHLRPVRIDGRDHPGRPPDLGTARRADRPGRHRAHARRQGGVPHAVGGGPPPPVVLDLPRRRPPHGRVPVRGAPPLPDPGRAAHPTGRRPLRRRAAAAGAGHDAAAAAQGAADRRAVAGPGTHGRGVAVRRGAPAQPPGHDHRGRRAVGERGPHPGRAGGVHGEGHGAVRGTDPGAAGPARHPPLGVHRRCHGHGTVGRG